MYNRTQSIQNIKSVLVLMLTLIPGILMSQGINRTSWEMNRGGGWSYLNFSLPSHGYPGNWNGTEYVESTGAYANANIPDVSNAGWGPAPNGETIGFSETSILPGNCLSSVDYTYFQTFVNVPTNTNVTQFNIVFSAIDDGGRITIFNNDYPSGVVVSGSYFTLSGGGTADLASYITTGQNRVVVTQVDDCPSGNNLQSATIVLNGQTVETCSVGEEQTFTILGANGSVGDIDPYSQSLPAGFTEWQPAYLSGGHPWGLIAGTNSWVNYSPDNTVGLNTRTPYRIRFEVPEDFSDPSMVFQLKADNRAVMWINNTFIDSVDGGGTITPADAVVSSALHPGVNEIRLLMVDWGGIVGFNYRIDVTMTSCEDITEAVLTPGEAAALNNAPTADAGPDQATTNASVVLDGSASSDPDENLLIYTWSENGTEIATGVNPTVILTEGSHAITLTVSDGELSDTDEVYVTVDLNEAPTANAGADQFIQSIDGSEIVSLDGSSSSDPDGNSLSYSWVLNGAVVSQVATVQTTLGYGVHTFTLTVDDGNGETDTDDVVVSVTDPLVAYWKAEGNGLDETPNNNDVSPAGSGDVNYCIGADGQGFEFTGSNWMEIPDKPSLNIGTGDLAIVMWAKLTEANGIETLLDKRDPNDGFKGYVVYTINNGFVGAQINTGNNYLNWISPINIADSQWHHIVFTIDRDNPTGGYITVDGTQTYVFDPTGFVGDVNNAAPLRIGGRNDGLENWVGCIDDVRLYNHSFTPEEILDDFDNVTPPVNEAPVADAGSDQTAECDPAFTLDGSGSTDDGALTYSWIKHNNLLVNGSFEDGMTGWTHSGVTGAGGNSIDRGAWGNATDGSWILDLVGTGDYAPPGRVEQTISTEVGTKYVVSFDIIVNGSPSLVVTFGDNAPQTFSATGSHSTEFTATSTSTTIILSSDGSYPYYTNSLFLDNVSVDGEASNAVSFTTTSLPAGSYTYTLIVTDASGVTDSDDVVVTVPADTEAPTIVLLGDNPASINIYNSYTDGGYTTADNCNSDVTVVVSGNVDGDNPGDYTLVYTATDESGNQAIAERTVTVVNTAPMAVAGDDQEITCVVENTDVFLSGSGSSDADGDGLSYSWTLNDAVVGSEESLNINLSAAGNGTHVLTLTVSDGFDSDSDEVVVTVVADTEPPVLTLLGDNPASVNIHNAFDDLGYEASDACNGDVTVTVDGSVDPEVPGDHTITYTATDAAGNTTTLSRVVTVINAAPVAVAGDDQTIDCAPGSADVTLNGSASSDADGDGLTYSWSLNDVVVGTEATLTKNIPAGTAIFTLTVSDGIDSHSDDVSVTVVADVEPPTLTLLGASPATLNIHIPFADDGYEASDLCVGDVTVVVEGTVDHEVPGDYTITYKATDVAGNETIVNRVVTVVNAAPVADAGEAQNIPCVVGSTDVILDGTGSSDADGDALTYSWTLGGSPVGSGAVVTTSLTEGEYTFTLTVSDGIDASSSEITVTVVNDNEAPIITLLGDNPMDLGLYLDYDEPGYEAEDLCGSDFTVEVTGTVDISTPGSYTITYTATDAGNNVSTEERVVEVFNTAPEVVNAVDGIELSYGDDFLSAYIDLSTVFEDIDIDDVLTYSFSHSNSDVVDVELSGSILTFEAVDLGESSVEITAVDPWNAEASQTFTALVNVTADLAGALLFAHSDIDIKKDVEIFSGNILVNESSSHGRGNHNDDEDDDDDGDDDDEDDDDEDDDDDHRHNSRCGHNGSRGNGHGNSQGRGNGHYEIRIDKDTHVAPGYILMADRIQLKRDVSIESDVYANELDNRGDITGDIFGDVMTPLFTTLPPFKSAPAGSQDIRVNKNQTLVLEPGDYGRIYVKDRGTLILTGGVYNIEKLEAKKYSHIGFETATEVRVEEKIKIAKRSYVGPADGSYITAANIIFYIAEDHHDAARLEEDVHFFGTIYAQNSDVDLKKEVVFTGAILADEIKVSKDADLTVDSYFSTGGGSLGKGSGSAWVVPVMEVEVPEVSALASNYPNPFNPSTTIDFALSQAGQVSLKVYDIRGAEVAVLANGFREAGHYTVHFTPENMSSGTYLYVIDSGSFREVKRMLYLK